MPSLDAAALTQDFEGMAFLASVLDAPHDAMPPAGAFDPDVARRKWTVQPSADDRSAIQLKWRVTESA